MHRFKHFLAVSAMAFLVSCGGGGSSAPSIATEATAPTPAPITAPVILPAPSSPSNPVVIGPYDQYPATVPSTRYDTPYYGYYLTNPTQVDETISHVNFLWEVPMFGELNMIHDMEVAQLPTLLEVGYYLWDNNGALLPDAEARLYAYFKLLQMHAVLHYVIAVAPIDEPDVSIANSDDIPRSVALIRRVAQNFPELANLKLAVIYAGVSRLTHSEVFDWIGFDDYDPVDGALTGAYKKLKSVLKPGQRTLLVPGGANNNGRVPADAAKWAQFTLDNSEVIAVIPFLWFSPDTHVIGIRDNVTRVPYCQAGRLLTRKPGAC
jgi:hypothetical protein